MRAPSEEALAITGAEFLWWCVQVALDEDCHLIYHELSTGGIQPIFWTLPGDSGYNETSEEVPLMRDSHN